ncbi:hypothetical protein P22_1399 [Propionispora sp. 2/2-37]|uniref:type I phosphomannose isomerase catalytic subunit n=1 Tax=Propionispora sp. 2/2-37 TaxID=1677858 RepID=UPI0006C497BF|nr:type I phosphomannose isomerase catalytic subunit [Propionispora sp. 2/2-37]CUH95329.1 hypothetical protein P22_1399 [Propionispora sp. 2/2-37]
MHGRKRRIGRREEAFNWVYPLKFKPVYKEMIWGGRALESLFGRKLPSSRIGESWELCTHPQGMSCINNGIWQGKTLQEVIEQQPETILGKAYAGQAQFPLLIKYIDANDHLSIQVHPGDEYARRVEGERGKTEAWYVVDAGPGAEIIYGLSDTVTREIFSQAVASGAVEPVLRRVAVCPGDLILVPAGTVHSLLKGVVVCEVQQSSDLTYRIHDFNRTGPDGKPRALHIEKALEVISFGEQPPLNFTQDSITCSYFSVRKWQVKPLVRDYSGGHFLVYCILQGSGQVVGNGVSTPVQAGETVLVPACLESVEIMGELHLLRIQ